MKKILLRAVGVLLVFISVALVCYPFISNYLMDLNQQSNIVVYNEEIVNTDSGTLEKLYNEAVEYNKSLLGNVIITDPFDPNFEPVKDYEYEAVINLNGDGIMATVEIPKINLSLPVYHGASKEVLESGAGHLQNTSLPVGGESTHSVITGHTGLSSAKLFTDLNLLKENDVFYINVLGKRLAYSVCKIYVVEPDDTKTLRVYEGEDFVTLITCTPYGVNSRRLLVRGTRIDEQKALELQKTADAPEESTWMREYKKALFAGAVILVAILVVFAVVRMIIRKKRTSKSSKDDNSIEISGE